MGRILGGIIAAAILAMPSHAAHWQEAAGIRPGAFVGARMHMSLGGKEPAGPRAYLAIAPSQTRISGDGIVRTRIGEGLALNVGRKPTLTVAGVPAASALGLQRQGEVDAKKKLGVSTAGWVAIGVGVAVLIGGLYFVHLVREADENSD